MQVILMKTSNPQYLLVIDNGTQSVRALVFDKLGQLVAKSKVEIEPYVSPHPGWAEQDPEYFWASLCKVCQQLWPMLDFPREAIKAVSVTTQRATVIALDHDGKSLRPAISWLDQRQVKTKPPLKTIESVAMKILGAKDAVNAFYCHAEANWIAQQQPEIWKKVHKYLLLSGYHNFKLTGRYTDALASQVGYLPFDFKRHCWANKNDWKWRVLPINNDMLPELMSAGETLGHITASASLETGIPAGLPLIASGSDKACEVLGSGCLDAETGSLSYGTTATFNITTKKYLETLPSHPAYPGVVPDTYNAEMIVQRGYWMVSWFKKEFGLREQRIAAEQGVAPESLFDDLLKAVPPGAMGLMLQPYWSSGTSNPEAKGAIIGFGDVHTRAHIYRAMIEGITFALREGKDLLEKRCGYPLKRLRVSGGGSQSDQIMQITADIFGMTVERPHTYETSGLGAAIAAAVGTGMYPDFKSAVAKMTHARDSFAPVAENHQIYNQLYENVYRKMYKSLQPSYNAIRAITGYPD
ncbi:MAG: sugar (pentulose or hexulose) kinase [Glaciecola sp.]|jgi:sugar (pentulose or hexulose) kinase